MKNLKDKMEIMLRELLEVNGWKDPVPEDENEREMLLKVLRTVSVPANLSDSYYMAEKEYIGEKTKGKDLVDIEDMTEELLDNIYFFKGDITTVKADAIVNAANEKLLGCFIPGHKCIDNAIHMTSGLGLRNACHKLMIDQGHDEEVGRAKITEGFNLPSKYVVHTVGPNIKGMGDVNMEEVGDELRSCYVSILEEVDKYEDIRNIVFCSISTGVYGVPIDFASQVALKTIREYLENEDHHLDRVVIDVFSKEDYDEYKHQAEKIEQEI